MKWISIVEATQWICCCSVSDEQICVANLCLKHSLITGPFECFESITFILALTFWMSAESTPPIGRGVSRLILGIFLLSFFIF